MHYHVTFRATVCRN